MTLLGQNSPVPERYAPEILDPIPRALARDQLGLDEAALPFQGEDIWHAWELAWLGPEGQPRTGVARLRLPVTTRNLVESKSLKLYLNSLNQSRFDSSEALIATLERDLGKVAGGEVAVEVLSLDSAELSITPLPGECIDGQPVAAPAAEPAAALLRGGPAPGMHQVLHSNALRSLCPVTAQPDWATVIVWLEGGEVEPASLLRYLGAYRNHQEFHEQCVERIFQDIRTLVPEGDLSVMALYTRRGGLDINPWRSTSGNPPPRLRSARQ